MSRPLENPLTFRSLYDSPIVGVSDYRCGAGRGGPEDEKHFSLNQIVLMRHSTFCNHISLHSKTTEDSQAAFFSNGSNYRVSAPANWGDRDVVIAITP